MAAQVAREDTLWYREARAPGRLDPRRISSSRCAPSTWRFDIGRKKDNYERIGVGELWLVDTAADAVYVFRRSRPDVPRFDVSLDFNPDEVLTSPLLPGFALSVARIFELDQWPPPQVRTAPGGR